MEIVLSSQIKKADEFYSYLNKETGNVETINILTGERVDEHALVRLPNYKYSKEFADIIAQQIREGMTMTAICKQDRFPSYGTISRWRVENPEFNDLLRQAKKDRAEIYMDKITEISQDAMDGNVDKDSVAAMRLAMDGFEKAAGSGDPAQYGKAKDQQVKIEYRINVSTGIDAPISIKQPEEKEAQKIED